MPRDISRGMLEVVLTVGEGKEARAVAERRKQIILETSSPTSSVSFLSILLNVMLIFLVRSDSLVSLRKHAFSFQSNHLRWNLCSLPWRFMFPKKWNNNEERNTRRIQIDEPRIMDMTDNDNDRSFSRLSLPKALTAPWTVPIYQQKNSLRTSVLSPNTPPAQTLCHLEWKGSLSVLEGRRSSSEWVCGWNTSCCLSSFVCCG